MEEIIGRKAELAELNRRSASRGASIKNRLVPERHQNPQIDFPDLYNKLWVDAKHAFQLAGSKSSHHGCTVSLKLADYADATSFKRKPVPTYVSFRS